PAASHVRGTPQDRRTGYRGRRVGVTDRTPLRRGGRPDGTSPPARAGTDECSLRLRRPGPLQRHAAQTRPYGTGTRQNAPRLLLVLPLPAGAVPRRHRSRHRRYRVLSWSTPHAGAGGKRVLLVRSRPSTDGVVGRPGGHGQGRGAGDGSDWRRYRPPPTGDHPASHAAETARRRG